MTIVEDWYPEWEQLWHSWEGGFGTIDRITSGAFRIHADAGDHLWAAETEKADQFHTETQPVEIYDDHWKECLGYALTGAMIFAWSLAELSQRVSNPPLTR